MDLIKVFSVSVSVQSIQSPPQLQSAKTHFWYLNINRKAIQSFSTKELSDTTPELCLTDGRCEVWGAEIIIILRIIDNSAKSIILLVLNSSKIKVSIVFYLFYIDTCIVDKLSESHQPTTKWLKTMRNCTVLRVGFNCFFLLKSWNFELKIFPYCYVMDSWILFIKLISLHEFFHVSLSYNMLYHIFVLFNHAWTRLQCWMSKMLKRH